MDQRTRRSPARFLAPLALIAVVVAFLAIVTSSSNNGSSSSTTTDSSGLSTTTTSSTTTSTSSKSHKKSSTGTSTAASSGPSVYIVKVGDTLGSIAAKSGVPLSTIQSLNPNVDPHAMIAGQRIKLR